MTASARRGRIAIRQGQRSSARSEYQAMRVATTISFVSPEPANVVGERRSDQADADQRDSVEQHAHA